MKEKQPILVTGAHRSGTTWVGKMLAAGGEAAYISEPLNVHHRPGVMRAPVSQWYTYICPENEAGFLPSLRETLAYQYHLSAEISSLKSRKDWMRMGRDLNVFATGRLLKRRPLLKDPFAVFSAPWFANRLNCQVVITVRHPAAFASSLKRLGWPFDFTDLLAQPLLMRDWLEPYRTEMEAALRTPQDTIRQGALLWCMIYGTVASFQQHFPGFMLVYHEDLSQDPVAGFQKLYAALSLTFSDLAQSRILNTSSAENPGELSQKKVHSVRLNSRANLHNWKHRLEPEEIRTIRSLTGGLADQYYPGLAWD